VSGILLIAVDGEDDAVSIGLNGKDKKLVITSHGKIDISADSEVTLKGSKITVQADGDLVLKGATVKIN